MTIIAKYHGEHSHNKAIIELVRMTPYFGAKKQPGYRLRCMSSDGFIYYMACYSTVLEAHKAATTKFGDLQLDVTA